MHACKLLAMIWLLNVARWSSGLALCVLPCRRTFRRKRQSGARRSIHTHTFGSYLHSALVAELLRPTECVVLVATKSTRRLAVVTPRCFQTARCDTPHSQASCIYYTHRSAAYTDTYLRVSYVHLTSYPPLQPSLYTTTGPQLTRDRRGRSSAAAI